MKHKIQTIALSVLQSRIIIPVQYYLSTGVNINDYNKHRSLATHSAQALELNTSQNNTNTFRAKSAMKNKQPIFTEHAFIGPFMKKNIIHS